MDFSDALRELKRGRKMRRRSWRPCPGSTFEHYIFLGEGRLWYQIEGSSSLYDQLSFDVLADDWVFAE